MRIFGKMSHFLHISRCLSYNAPICRPHRLLHGSSKQWKKICSNCVCWQPPLLLELNPSMPAMIHVQFHSQRATNVFTFNANMDMLRKRISFSGTPSEGTENAANIVPIGIIMPENTDGKNLKIVIVPLDIANQDTEALKNTLEAINQLRKHSQAIDAFTNSMIEDFNNENNATLEEQEQTPNKQEVNFWNSCTQEIDAVATNTATPPPPPTIPGEQELQKAAVAALGNNLALSTNADVAPMVPAPCTPNMPNMPSPTPMSPTTVPVTTPQTQPSVLPLGDPKESQISAEEVSEVEQISIDVPHSLGKRLSEMAISSMHLSFEMNMTNVRDAILLGQDAIESSTPSTGSDAMVFMETKVEVDPLNEANNTVPLQFNALIKGTVKIDADKLSPEQLTDEGLPDYNDNVTSIAANICSSALQQGFSPVEDQAIPKPKTAQQDGNVMAKARMALKRHQAQKHMKIQYKPPKMIDEKATLSNPGIKETTMSTMAMPNIESPYLKDGCKYPIIKKKKKCPKPCKLDDPCKEPCNRPQPKKNPQKKALSKVEITSSAKKGGKDPCAKGGKGKEKKKDPCAKKGGKGDKKGGKGDKKKDPCAKFKKGAKGGDKKKDPCAKKGGKGDKKKDPCAKKDGKGDKKKDPCAKFKKDKKGGDKKKDPCAKKGGKGDKKKDPCAKFKKDKKGGGDKKKDPCAKKGGKGDKKGGKGDKKKDPCAKFKKGAKGGDKKKDPCAKKGGKGDKKGGKGDKKKDPCAKFKKGGAGDKKKDPCKKKYSSIANDSPLPTKRCLSTSCLKSTELSSKCTLTTKPARFVMYTTRVRRRYSGNPSRMQMNAWGFKSFVRGFAKKGKGKGKKNDSKCDALTSAMPKNRKHSKKRTGLRTDCYASYEDECPKKLPQMKCDTVKFPRKKCEKGMKKPKPVKMQKQKKKLPAVCKFITKSSKDKERNELLEMGPLIINQSRMLSVSSHSRKLNYSRVTKTALNNPFPEEEDQSKATIEVIKIPKSYEICREQKVRPSLKQFDVLIRTGSIALTGSDIHVYENANRDFEGITLGHDATGFVEEVGSCVHNLHVGDRVVMESALSCGVCDFCKQGLYNICTDLVYNGFLASHQSHPADLCHRLPDSITMEEGTLTQTLAMGCQACFKANITPTSNVLIIGSTPTAVSAAMCASAIGAKKVTIAGTMGSTLETINQYFGFQTIHFDPNALFGEVLEAVYHKFSEWPNSVINCAITPMTMNLAVMALQPCGVCVLAECECECASFNALDILMKNIRLIPSFRSANMYPTALQLMKSGRAPMRNFIAQIYPWNKLDDAFKCAQYESNVGLRKIIVNSTEECSKGNV